jgi:hypothetical protein
VKALDIIWKQLCHAQEEKQFYWGKNEKIYKFYDNAETILSDLMVELRGNNDKH